MMKLIFNSGLKIEVEFVFGNVCHKEDHPEIDPKMFGDRKLLKLPNTYILSFKKDGVSFHQTLNEYDYEQMIKSFENAKENQLPF